MFHGFWLFFLWASRLVSQFSVQTIDNHMVDCLVIIDQYVLVEQRLQAVSTYDRAHGCQADLCWILAIVMGNMERLAALICINEFNPALCWMRNSNAKLTWTWIEFNIDHAMISPLIFMSNCSVVMSSCLDHFRSISQLHFMQPRLRWLHTLAAYRPGSCRLAAVGSFGQDLASNKCGTMWHPTRLTAAARSTRNTTNQ